MSNTDTPFNAVPREGQQDREVSPPHKFGQNTVKQDQNAEQVYVENQYGEMEPSTVVPEARWGRGGIPEVDSNPTCTDEIKGKAEKLIGKMTGNEEMEKKGLSHLGTSDTSKSDADGQEYRD